MTTPDLGPAELITLVFPGERADPGVAEVLAELAAGRDIRLLDLVFVIRTSGDLVRITGAREDLDDIGLGALGVSTSKLISENDLGSVRDWLRPGTSAAVIAYQHSWARRLARAVRDAGGMVMLGRSSGQQQAQEQQLAQEQQAQEQQAQEQQAQEQQLADLISRLADLARLHDSGALSAAEFDAAKARLLAS